MEPVAIVGMAFKMPQGVADEESLWEMVASGRNVMTEWPSNRLTVESFHDESRREPNSFHGRGGHFLDEDPGVFDAPFFSISGREAAAMDPQHRWALEVTYHALENSGMRLEKVRGSRMAVFACSFADDYARMQAKDPDAAPRHGSIGTASSSMANRVSWFLDAKGPSVHVDTACSSGLVALNMACQALGSGDATAAVVVGCSTLLSPDLTGLLANMGFLSPDSRCYSFDARANGFARGEGAVAVVVKPLAQAVAAGDCIRGVVRATACNQDGRTPTLTQPSAAAQELLIRHVYAKVNLPLDSTRYVEAHGTGTAVGDPVEITAIGRVFRTHRAPTQPLYVGSLKANVGHLEAASGLASVVKCLLMLERGLVPPVALFESLNPDIDAAFYNVAVPTRCLPWPSQGLRRVSVQSFGFGGTNAHAVLDDAASCLHTLGLQGLHQVDFHPSSSCVVSDHANPPCSKDLQPKLLVLSAADAQALERMSDDYSDYFPRHIAGKPGMLRRLSHTLATRRTLMPWRGFAVVDEGFPSLPVLSKPARTSSSEKPAIAFIFTGQGAQYAGMGRALMQYPVFKASMTKGCQILTHLGCEWSCFDVIDDADMMNSPVVSQPLCTILQLALVDLLLSFDIIPVAVVGHSSGEIAAAYAIGALTFESACRIAYYRGKVADSVRRASSMDPGAMLSVGLGEAQMSPYLTGTGIHLACINSPSNVTLSGPSRSLELLQKRLNDLGIFTRTVHTGVAYHSPAMQSVSYDYEIMMGTLQPSKHFSMAPMFSSVTGQPVALSTLVKQQYWLDNLISPVKFVHALQNLLRDASLPMLRLNTPNITDVIEIGPHSTLRLPIKETLPSINYHSVLQREKSPLHTLLNLLGTLFARGYDVNLSSINNPDDGPTPFLTNCPPYPFDHSKRYWSESRLSKDYRLRNCSPGQLVGKPAHDWNPLQPRWRNWLCIESFPWLADHVVNEVVVCPATGMLSMAIEAARQMVSSQARPIAGFFIKDALFLAPILIRQNRQDAIETVVELRPMQNEFEKNKSRSQVVIYTCHEGNWKICFKTEIHVQMAETSSFLPSWSNESSKKHAEIRREIQSASAECNYPVDQHLFYASCEQSGLRYGPSFQLLSDIRWDGQNASVARIDIATVERHHDVAKEFVHPAVLDSLLHLLLSQRSKGASETVPTCVPQRINNAWISAKSWKQATRSVHVWSSTRRNGGSFGSEEAKIYAIDSEGSVLTTVEGLVTAQISKQNQDQKRKARRTLIHRVSWMPQLSSLSGKQIQQFVSSSYVPNEDLSMKSFYPKMEKAIRLKTRKSLQRLTHCDRAYVTGYRKHYLTSLERQVNSEPYMDDGIQDDELESLLRECENERPAWRLLTSISRALNQILTEEVNPLEIMFGDKAAEEFYSQVLQNLARDSRLVKFLDLATHENPGLQILEVGAGTGGMTHNILATLGELERCNGQRRFKEYTYTDVSPSFFEGARNRFQEFGDRMKYRKLDLERDPFQQLFGEAEYDMIFAGSVLHATSNLNSTLTNLRKLLKPSGHLVLLEITALDSACANVTFGSLEGWWAATEDYRRYSPLVSETKWDDLLRATGFSGADVLMRDYEDEECHITSIMITTAISAPKQALSFDEFDGQNIIIVLDPASASHKQVALNILERHPTAQMLDFPGLATPETQIPSTSIAASIVVFLLEIEGAFLSSLGEPDFLKLRRLLQKVQNICWVASVGNLIQSSLPPISIASGFFRSFRIEQSSKHVVTLDMESFTSGSEASLVSDVLEACFLKRPACTELEFRVQDNLLHIGRLQEDTDLDIERDTRVNRRSVYEPWNSKQPLKLELGTPGLLDTLRFSADVLPELNPEDVEITAAAWPVSFRDLFISVGRLGDEEMGFECTGTVSRVGAAAAAKFSLGDRVLMVSVGCLRSHPRAPASNVFKLPTNVSFHEAIAGMNPGMTAWYSLAQVARLQRGETILIHAAAGSTGQMAVKIARYLGAEVFVTVGTDTKRQLLMETKSLNIPESHIFYSRNTDFADGIKRATNGRGVDVVLNSLSGPGLLASWDCVAPNGRFVDIGKSDIMANSSLPMANFAKNVTFSSVDLLHIVLTNNALTRQLVEQVLHLITYQGFGGGPTPVHVFGASDVQKAFRYMQSGENTGRIIIDLDTKEEVPVSLTSISR